VSVFGDTSALYAVLDADDDEHSRAIAERGFSCIPAETDDRGS